MSATWHTQPDAKATAEAAAHHVMGLLEEVLGGQDSATLAISGGSTPKRMFEILAASKLRWDLVHIFFVDERCVPPTDEQSNFGMAGDHLLRPARIPPEHVHRIHGELAPQAGAQRYVEDIRGFFGLEAGQMPRFDVVHLGMGPDAHTASLFPGQALIDDREQIAAAVYVDKFKMWRVTLLPGVLLAAKHTVFLVAGDDKAESVRSVFHDGYDPRRLPAQVVSQQGRGVTWFLDQAAAKLLE